MEKEIKGERNGHTSRANLLKRYFNPKYGFVTFKILNMSFGSDLQEFYDELQNYWDDGMFISHDYNAILNDDSPWIEYSLNKHKRWTIPKIVHGSLNDVTKEDFRVVVYERKIPTSHRDSGHDIRKWADCVAYTDSKGNGYFARELRNKSTFCDQRRIFTDDNPPQRKKLPWKYHNKHWRGVQRKEGSGTRHTRNSQTQDTKPKYTDLSLQAGLDNDKDCIEIRYEVGYPDKVNNRLKVIRNQGHYAIESRVPDYHHYKWDKGRQKALKKTKGRRNNTKSWKFLQGDYYQQLKDEMIDYQEEDTQFIRTCARNSKFQDNICCCTCQWSGGDNCCCFGEYVYNDSDICSCHGNYLQDEQKQDVSLKVNLSSIIHNKDKQTQRKKKQTKPYLDNVHPNTAMSKSVSRWFGKMEFIPCEREEDELVVKSKTDEGSVHSESDSGISSTVETSSDLQTDIPSLTCYITRKSLRDCIMSGQCQLGQAVPLRCSFHLDIGNGDVESEFSLMVVEKLDTYHQPTDIGEYLLRIHSLKEEQLLEDIMDNLQQSLTQDDLLVFSMKELLDMGRLAIQTTVNATSQSCMHENDKSMNLLSSCSDGSLESADEIQISKIPFLDLVSEISGESIQFQIKTVKEAYVQLKDDQTLNNVNVASVLETILDTQFDLKSNDILCEICLTSLEDDVDFTSLLPCRHFFCNRCVSYYILERIRNGAQQIECLEHDCHTVLDDTSILSLIPSTVFNTWQNRKLETIVENSGKWTWCPNNSCDKVVTVMSTDSLKNPSVQCQCSRKWCLNCQNEAHWPSTCDQAQKYNKFLQRNDEVQTVFVKVKRCPGCKYPIEKRGGCSIMTCRCCRESFCWICLTPWRDHQTQVWNMQCRRNVEETVVEFSNREFSLSSQYHLQSAQHRKQWMKMHDHYIFHNAMRIVERFVLRERVFCHTGWRKVWNEKVETLRKDLCQNITYNLLLIRECHRLLERLYIVMCHSTRRMSVRNSMQNTISKVEFIVDRLQEVTEEFFSPVAKDRQQRLKDLLFQNMRILLAQAIYLQNIIQKKKFLPSPLKSPKFDDVRYT